MRPAFDVSRFHLMKAKGESMQTSIRGLLSRAVRSRVAGVAVALLAALGIVVQGLAAPAVADVNPQIEITDMSLTKIDPNEVAQDGALYVNGLALLKFEWDASKTTPKAGDSFTITLPEQLDFHSTLERPIHYDAANVDLGKCTIDGKTVTCTFDERITPLVQAGNKNIQGVGKFQLAAKSSTTQEELPFVINGDKAPKTVQVDLPGTGGIIVGQSKYNPDKRIYKGYTGIMKEGDTKATWLFHFGGPSLQQALNLTFDGQTERTITFKDTLGAGMKCPLQSVILYAVDSEQNPSQSFELDNGLERGPKTTDQGAFEVTGKCDEPKADGTTLITFEVKGPFRAKTNYMVSYSTLFTGDDGKALPGTDYTNTVSADRTTITSTNTVSFVAAGSVSAFMNQGEGTFSITKKIASDYVNQVAAGVSFDVAFDYELPLNTTKADYPNWTPPANTLNADNRTGTATMKVTRGQPISFDKPFPTGTVISNLREDISKANRALPDGYVWKDPKFTIGSTATTSLTIGDRTTTKVDLLNTVGVGVADNGFQVVKNVSGAEGAAAKKFSFSYTCTLPNNTTKSGQITDVPGDGTPVASTEEFPVGTTCEVTEETAGAGIDGYTLDPAGHDTQSVTIGRVSAPTVTATFTNTYTPLTGGFVISKTVDGDGAALANDKEFTFGYTCTPLTGAAQVEGTVVVKGGENGAVTDVPVGSCSVSERDATINGASLNTVLTVDGSSDGVNNGTAVFNVKDGVTVQVAATNTYVLDRGSFSVAKTVVGGADSFTKDTFVFDYVCTDGTEGRLDVPGDGTAVEGPRVPTGTECTVTERAQTANRDGYTVTSELSDNGKVTISQKDAVVAVTATNTYTPVPKVPSKQLAKTGASNVAVVGVVGSLLVVVGGVLIALKRRRHDA